MLKKEKNRANRLSFRKSPPLFWRERNLYRMMLALVLALFTHLLILFSVPYSPPQSATHNLLKRNVSVISMPKGEWESNFKIKPQQEELKPLEKTVKPEPPKPEQKEEALTKKEKEELKNKQVVDVAPTEDKTPPEEYKYLSEYNTNTKKETVSKYQQKDYVNAAPKPSIGAPPVQANETTDKDKISITDGDDREKASVKSESEAQKSKMAFHLRDIPLSEELKLRLNEERGTLQNKEKQDAVKGDGDKNEIVLYKPSPEDKKFKEQAENEGIPGEEAGKGPKKNLTLGALIPSQNALDRVMGAPAPDALPELEKGEETLLNSREFKYASFFNRVKKKIAQHWEPGLAYRLRDPSGNIYGYKDRHTILEVHLSDKGALKSATVVYPSGAAFLDEEAVRAVQSASPFPNPPTGLIDENDEVVFNFGFYFEISGAPFQIFRNKE